MFNQIIPTPRDLYEGGKNNANYTIEIVLTMGPLVHVKLFPHFNC